MSRVGISGEIRPKYPDIVCSSVRNRVPGPSRRFSTRASFRFWYFLPKLAFWLQSAFGLLISAETSRNPIGGGRKSASAPQTICQSWHFLRSALLQSFWHFRLTIEQTYPGTSGKNGTREPGLQKPGTGKSRECSMIGSEPPSWPAEQL